MTDFNIIVVLFRLFGSINSIIIWAVAVCFVSGHTFMARWGDTKNWRSQRVRKTARLLLSWTCSWRRSVGCVGVTMRRNGKYVQNIRRTKRFKFQLKNNSHAEIVCVCVCVFAMEFSKWHSIHFFCFAFFFCFHRNKKICAICSFQTKSAVRYLFA